MAGRTGKPEFKGKLPSPPEIRWRSVAEQGGRGTTEGRAAQVADPQIIEKLNRLIESGPFEVHVAQTFSLDQIVKAPGRWMATSSATWPCVRAEAEFRV